MKYDESEQNKKGVRKRTSTDPIDPERLVRLIARAQSGEVEAFQLLYLSYAKKIFNFLFRMSGSREEAEDLAQETFILAFRKLNSLKEAVKFQGWLFRIAQNCFYQKHRGKKPQIESIDEEGSAELSDVQKLATPGLDPEHSILSDELQEVIRVAIQELPEKYRTVFVLSAIQKLSYQQISEIVNRSMASVKSDIHRARVAVRDKIKGYLGENYGMSNMF